MGIRVRFHETKISRMKQITRGTVSYNAFSCKFLKNSRFFCGKTTLFLFLVWVPRSSFEAVSASVHRFITAESTLTTKSFHSKLPSWCLWLVEYLSSSFSDCGVWNSRFHSVFDIRDNRRGSFEVKCDLFCSTPLSASKRTSSRN